MNAPAAPVPGYWARWSVSAPDVAVTPIVVSPLLQGRMLWPQVPSDAYLTFRPDLSFVAVSQINPLVACGVLGRAVDSLKQRLDYSGLYAAYLIGQLSEEEFRSEAEAYALTPNPIPCDEIRTALVTLGAFTKAEFTVTELADMLGTDEESVQMSLPLLTHEAREA
jgi:hypothetical protein